jgi:hypothetical protein
MAGIRIVSLPRSTDPLLNAVIHRKSCGNNAATHWHAIQSKSDRLSPFGDACQHPANIISDASIHSVSGPVGTSFIVVLLPYGRWIVSE